MLPGFPERDCVCDCIVTMMQFYPNLERLYQETGAEDHRADCSVLEWAVYFECLLFPSDLPTS